MSEADQLAPLALTMGEPAGISGELTIQAWLERQAQALPAFFAIDDPDRLERIARNLGLNAPLRAVASPEEAADAFASELPVMAEPLSQPVAAGRPDPRNGEAILSSIRRAVEFALGGRAGAVVTSPIHKKSLYDAGFRYPGHTEFLASLVDGAPMPVMMLVVPTLRVVPVTIHMPLARAVSELTTDAIVHCGRVTAAALTRDFAIPKPVLAVAGLNPHAGESGALGREEIQTIAPAVKALSAEGIMAVGPLPADTLFHPRARARYNAALCMYHDQALIPLKTIDFDHGVNVTLGLPFVRTSPDHGTALEIAGKGLANPASLIAAIKLAGEVAARRAAAGNARSAPALA